MMGDFMFQPPSDQDTIRSLFSLGYFQGKEWEEVRKFLMGSQVVSDALDHYRDFHQLTGNEDPSTHMLFPRCGMPDLVRSPEESRACKWPMLDVTCAHRLSGLNPLSAEQEHQAWLDMIENWNSVCGIRLKYQEDMDTANIYATPGSTGAGVLAYSYLPCGASQSDRMQQVYNSKTNWSYALLLQVMTHEIGHAIGLDHGPRGSLMQPTASGDITKPQSWDIAEVVARYGAPNPKPPPGPPPPNPPGPVELVIIKTIQPGKYRLVPVEDTVAGNGDSSFLDMT